MTNVKKDERRIFDFFISYKQRDSSPFAEAIVQELRIRKYDIWLDSDQMHPGDSILKSIENGLSDSIDALLILSKNYFDGWSEFERRAIFSLMVGKTTRLIPIWYQLEHKEIQRISPMLADIVGIPASKTSTPEIQRICDKIGRSYRPSQRRHRLYELFFQCVAKNFPEDSDVALFLAVFENDVEALKVALERGADPNITDAALWNRYNKIALTCCFPEWRKLFLHLSETGAIGNSPSKLESGG